MRFSHYDGKQPKGTVTSGGGSSSLITKLLETDNSNVTALTESLENYDFINVVGFLGDRTVGAMFPVEFIANNYTSVYDNNKCFQLSNDSRAINFYFVDSENISYYQNGDYFIKAIYGIKL